MSESAENRQGSGKALVSALVAVVLSVGAVLFVIRNRDREAPGESDSTKVELSPATAKGGDLPTQVKFDWKKIDDPSADGWSTEVFNGAAGKVLKKISAIIRAPQKINETTFASLVADDFRCTALQPAALTEVFTDSATRVERGGATESQEFRFTGSAGLADAVRELMAGFEGATDIHSKFKLFRIVREDGSLVTSQYVSISGHTKSGMLEQNAMWDISWSGSMQEPRLSRIQLANFEQVTYASESGAQFVDCTKSVLGGNASYANQLLYGASHWFARTQDRRYFNLLGNPGLAIGDVNGDGLDDVYVCQEEGLPNKLFVQQPDGSADDVSSDWEVDWLHTSRGVLLLDLDNDGDQDLLVATVGHLIVATNEGKKFRVHSVLPTDDDNMTLSAADYDNDGDIDVYVCAYFKKEILRGEAQSNTAVGAVGSGGAWATSDAGHNVLFRNDLSGGELKFVDATKETGLDKQNTWFSFASSWEDFDNDGDMDLYVSNDYARNNLYRNDGGRFVDVAEELGVGDQAFGMSVAWGDYDHDENMDLYVSNMFSSAGGRVTGQLRDQDADVQSKLRRFARGNTLLKNAGQGRFEDVSVPAGVTVGRWAWGAGFVDINNDSWDDLVVANGYLTTDDTGDL